MWFELRWLEPLLVVSRLSGEAPVDKFATLLKTLVTQPEFKPGVKIPADVRELDALADAPTPSGSSAEDTKAVIDPTAWRRGR